MLASGHSGCFFGRGRRLLLLLLSLLLLPLLLLARSRVGSLDVLGVGLAVQEAALLHGATSLQARVVLVVMMGM